MLHWLLLDTVTVDILPTAHIYPLGLLSSSTKSAHTMFQILPRWKTPNASTGTLGISCTKRNACFAVRRAPREWRPGVGNFYWVCVLHVKSFAGICLILSKVDPTPWPFHTTREKVWSHPSFLDIKDILYCFISLTTTHELQLNKISHILGQQQRNKSCILYSHDISQSSSLEEIIRSTLLASNTQKYLHQTRKDRRQKKHTTWLIQKE